MTSKIISIKSKLIIMSVLFATVPLLCLAMASYNTAKSEIFRDIEANLGQQAIVLGQQVKAVYELAKNKVASDLSVAKSIFYAGNSPYIDTSDPMTLKIVNQLTNESKTVVVPKMKTGEAQVAYQYDTVDKIKATVGGTATIFQLIPEGLLRISTNVLQHDGARAVGTYIPTDSPVYKAILNGDTFYGRAFVVNAWYITAYEPIRDTAGAVIGALYVGIREDVYQENLRNNLSRLIVGKTGYVFIINEKGDYILSYQRKRDGENIWNARDARGMYFIQEIVHKAVELKEGETAVTYYPWQNKGESEPRMKAAGYVYSPEWKWIIAASAYHSDFLDGLNKIKIITALVTVFAILLASGAGYWFASTITKPLLKIVNAIRDFAKGDLDQTVSINKKDETGVLAESLNTMVLNLKSTADMAGKVAGGDLTVQVSLLSDKDALGHSLQEMVTKLSNIVSEIQISSSNVAAGSQELSATSQSISQGSTEQASSLEEITSSLNEISSQTKITAEHALQANRLAAQARDAATAGNSRMQAMVSAMNEINQSSQSISKIIKVIDEIAFQTNLLALNAAVEAARAGKHGKGFAVVAEEVRNLAARSARAAKETAELIEGSVKKVGNGTEVAGQTAQALEEIVTFITRAADIIGAIAASSGEQSNAIANINTGLSQIEQVNQQSTAHAEESAAAAEELSSQAQILQQLITTFKIDDRKTGATSRKQISTGAEPMAAHQKMLCKKMLRAAGSGRSSSPWSGAPVAASADPVIYLGDQEFGKY